MAIPRRGVREVLTPDIRHALRRLRRDWRFTAGAVLILALGIGVNTAIFSVINSALFRVRGAEEPSRIVNIYENVGEDNAPLATSYPAYLDIAEYSDVFDEVGAVTMLPMTAKYQAEDRIRSALIEHVTSGYLAVLGLEPAAGRWIDPESDGPGGEAEVVVGYQTWLTRFESDPGLIGQVVLIEGTPLTVVGIGPAVLSSSIDGGVVTDFWLSMSTVSSTGAPSGLLNERVPYFVTRARLAGGITPARAQAAMDNLAVRIESDYPDSDPGRGITVLGFEEVRVHPQLDVILLPSAAVLLTVVGLVLVLACSNLSTLLLVRGTSRSREIGVRLALGASRRQLLAHLLTESVALAVAGGLGGLVLAHWTIRLIGLLDLPITVDFSLDYRVFGFALGLSLVTGIAFGLVPALKATAVDLVRALRDEGPTLSTGRRWLTAKNMLLTVQVAVSMVLLAATGLLIRSFVEASGQEMGFALDGVAMLETDARYAGYDAAGSEAVYNELVERIRAIPGVEAATRSLGAPVEDFLGSRALIIDGYEPADGEQSVPVQWMMAGPDYFETLQIPILFGRGFEQLDRQDSPRVAIINETMAQRYFGTRNAVGRRFRYDGESESVEVVGVAANILQELVASEPIQARFYRTWTQAEIPATTVIARGSIDAGILLAAMHRELIALDPTLPEIRARTMAAHVEDSTRMGRFLIGALGGLALLGMALAGVGLYAVVSYGVTNRFREIGIRMALGAKPAQVVRIVARDVSVLVGVGVGLGIAMTVGGIVTLGVLAANASDVGNIIQPSANYPWTFLVVALVMLGVGLLAAYLPARRAATVNPLEALRHS